MLNDKDFETLLNNIKEDCKNYNDEISFFSTDNSNGEKETVSHPNHYNNKYECIDVMRDVFGDQRVYDFCLINAFKYLYRATKKNGDEDVKKARWYLSYIEDNFM